MKAALVIPGGVNDTAEVRKMPRFASEEAGYEATGLQGPRSVLPQASPQRPATSLTRGARRSCGIRLVEFAARYQLP